MSSPCNILSLAFAARHNTGHFRCMVQETDYLPWHGTGPEEFTRAFDKIMAILNDPCLKKLFRLSLSAAFLLADSRPAWVSEFMVQMVRPHTIMGLDQQVLDQGDWVRVPVLVAIKNTARCQWFVAGLVTMDSGPVHIPAWALNIMDNRFQDQIDAAQSLVRRMGPDPANQRFVLLPLAPANNYIQLTGGSGALGLALAFKSLAVRHRLSPALGATGCLDDQGNIMTVGHLDAKIKAAATHGLNCLLIPAGNRPGMDVKDIIPVTSFSQAWTIADLYSGKQDNLLFAFSRALTDPREFIDKMDSLPGDWLTREKKTVAGILEQIFDNMDLFSRFTQKFIILTEDFPPERARALAALAPRTLPNHWPMAALKWCTANLALNNHQGRVKAAYTWETKGVPLAEQVINMDINLVAEFYNHALVSAHNRFEFYTTLPEPLFRLTAFMRQRLALQGAIGAAGDPVMGRLFGTLVQNSAFSGPENIKKTEEMSLKARQALGEGLTPETRSQWMRQYDYLTSARLAAGDMDGARDSLKTYLGIQNTEELPAIIPGLSCWQISLVCRFLAVARPENMEKVYPALKLCLFDNFTPAHPWQLSFFNLGRTAMALDRKQEAKTLFKKSLEICLAESSGPTIEILALKAVAFLEDLNLTAGDIPELYLLEERIQKAAAQLNPAWFYFLSGWPFSKVLTFVRENLNTIFPFSYL